MHVFALELGATYCNSGKKKSSCSTGLAQGLAQTYVCAVWHRTWSETGEKGTEQSSVRHIAGVLCLQEAETGKHRKWDDLIKSEETAAGMGGR